MMTHAEKVKALADTLNHNECLLIRRALLAYSMTLEIVDGHYPYTDTTLTDRAGDCRVLADTFQSTAAARIVLPPVTP